MCFDLTLFHTYKRITPITIHLPNHHIVQAHFSGTILFAFDFYLSNIYFYHNFRVISFLYLISLNNYLVNLRFFPNKCVIQDLISLKMIGVADVVNGLYTMTWSNCFHNQSTNTFAHLFSSATSCLCNISKHFPISNLWHFGLGHPSIDKLHVLKKFDNTITSPDTDLSCDVCHFAKMKKLSFSPSTTVSQSCYDLIHGDIRGPFNSPSILGHRYFLTIVDYFSRYTWVFCMKTKTDLPYKLSFV